LVTRRLVSTAQPLEITVHDHLIVTRSSVTSLRARGLI
jgi:DNA repair protein RadC